MDLFDARVILFSNIIYAILSICSFVFTLKYVKDVEKGYEGYIIIPLYLNGFISFFNVIHIRKCINSFTSNKRHLDEMCSKHKSYTYT